MCGLFVGLFGPTFLCWRMLAAVLPLMGSKTMSGQAMCAGSLMFFDWPLSVDDVASVAHEDRFIMFHSCLNVMLL